VSGLKKKVRTITIGCRLNQADTGLLCGRLVKAGYSLTGGHSAEVPDIVIVNTCSVTASASQKSRQAARSVRHKYPDALVIAAGCSCNVEKELWESGNLVDLALTNIQKKEIVSLIDGKLQGRTIPSEAPSANGDNDSFHEDAFAIFPFKSRAYLKIQEGCNSSCTYCIVPKARGRERSRKKDEVIREFRNLVDAVKGVSSFILT